MRDYKEILKEIDLDKFRTSKIDVCPNCEGTKIVRMKTDHYHGEILCQECGAVIKESIPLNEIPEICVSEREMEIELNTYRGKKSDPDYHQRVGKLSQYPELMAKYDRESEDSKLIWDRRAYKRYVGVVNTNFQMTKTQQRRVLEFIDDHNNDLKALHRQCSYEAIITALCILSMRKDKRRISFDNKGMNKSQFEFVEETGLTEKKYIRIVENCTFPALKRPNLNTLGRAFKPKLRRL